MLSILTLPVKNHIAKTISENDIPHGLIATSFSTSLATIVLFTNHNFFHFRAQGYILPTIALLATDPVLLSTFINAYKSTEQPTLLFPALFAASGISFALNPLVTSAFNSNQKITALLASSVAVFSLGCYYSS